MEKIKMQTPLVEMDGDENELFYTIRKRRGIWR